MRVFITGASGWLGSALIPQLTAAGHQVVGLARSERSAAALSALGAEVQLGSLDDLAVLRDAAAASDGVIHLAFKHEEAFSGNFGAATDADRAAVEAMCEALAGSDKPFVLASGLLGLTPGQVATERDGLEPLTGPMVGPAARLSTAQRVLALGSEGIRSSVMRLAPTNHGDGDNGFMATIVNIAREKRVSAYVGDGANRWPAIHRLDSATLFRLALEQAPPASVLHATAEEGVPLREVAEVIGKHLDIPVVSISPDEAPAHFTWLAHFVGLDSPASNTLTRELLGWEPVQPGLIADLDQGHYFR